MTDLYDVQRELDAVYAAETRKNLAPLISLLRSKVPLTSFGRDYLALRLEGKRLPGLKPNEDAKFSKMIDLVHAYLWLKKVEGWKKDEAIYQEIQLLTKAKSAASIKAQIMKAKKVKLTGFHKMRHEFFNQQMLYFRLGAMGEAQIRAWKPQLLRKQ